MSGSDKIRAFIAKKEADKPRRKLSDVERKRLLKLQGIQKHLRRGKNVQNRMLQTWLLDDEYAAIEAAWQEQKNLREELRDKPQSLISYEAMLKKALFSHNRADGMSSRGNSETARRLRYEAERQFEAALEFLEDVLAADAALRLWLDRDIDMSPGSNLSPSPAGMPRVITSRSTEKYGSGLYGSLMTKRELKLSIVEMAIQKIRFG